MSIHNCLFKNIVQRYTATNNYWRRITKSFIEEINTTGLLTYLIYMNKHAGDDILTLNRFKNIYTRGKIYIFNLNKF